MDNAAGEDYGRCQVRLVLPYPPSANAYWKPSRGRGLVPSGEALAYKATVARLVAATGAQPLAGPVRLSLAAYRPRRVGDLDNTLKVLGDALNGLAWLDDEQVVAIYAERADDAKAPRVEIVATAARHATPEEAAAHRQARAERAAKARATRNRNRAAKAKGKASRKSLANLATPAVRRGRAGGAVG
ncbi:phage associated protein [Corallococcus coralloides DSM 2259]|uniref:Phage associated protein n=1 Tax=Corallococcus coralloides (strain ATCC 25202 / DSM 2259 / NBRC 100086 / M2) TaxID=1144275 RepID=H8MVQ8_CORCM|nr:RusA family crossover junction endodeoxyribonuclease [Corallococcus coralloides]AFE10288.1 phage associated protein [Corallococcus coralloides DSM 2259]